MTTESVKINWSTTCEKCLGHMVKRRITFEGDVKWVVQCTRCRFYKEIEQ
ncbi:hypothetical protein GF325_08430 [Candidatus Bathyarchaeota archaeon]|nr:hypothetical protein [Candidatus Bathyarchaeota archaeon]